MSGLEIKAAMIRRQTIGNLGHPSHSVSKSGAGVPRVSPSARDLTEGVAESPGDFSGPGSLRPGESVQQQVPELPVIDSARNYDLANDDSAVEKNDQGARSIGLGRESANLGQTEPRVSLPKSDQLSFDLDPR